MRAVGIAQSLAMNGIALAPDEDGLYDLAMGVASGELAYRDMLSWVRSHRR